MPLNDAILDAVANANFKTMAELATQNAIGHQHRTNLIAEASLGKILENMNTLDPTEAAGISTVVSADLAERLGELAGAVASSQQLMKGAQTTLPETGR
jgi:hypothetical protein